MSGLRVLFRGSGGAPPRSTQVYRMASRPRASGLQFPVSKLLSSGLSGSRPQASRLQAFRLQASRFPSSRSQGYKPQVSAFQTALLYKLPGSRFFGSRLQAPKLTNPRLQAPRLQYSGSTRPCFSFQINDSRLPNSYRVNIRAPTHFCANPRSTLRRRNAHPRYSVPTPRPPAVQRIDS